MYLEFGVTPVVGGPVPHAVSGVEGFRVYVVGVCECYSVVCVSPLVRHFYSTHVPPPPSQSPVITPTPPLMQV